MTNITQQDKEAAEIFGFSAEEAAQARAQNEMVKGTYDFTITGGKVTVVAREGLFKDAIEVNLYCDVLASDGTAAKRYGKQFCKFTLPTKNGSFVPTAKGIEIGLGYARWLSEQTGVPMAELASSLKGLTIPTGLLQKTVRGYYHLRADKNDANKFYPEIRPAKKGDKVVNVKPGAAPQAVTGAVRPADDSDMPF